MVDILISRGADIESRNAAGLTPLACAAGKGKVDMVKWLLKKGADVNSRSAMGWTAIKLAVQLKEAEVVRVLLKNGAYPEGEQNLDERMILWPKKKEAGEMFIKLTGLHHSQCCDICESGIPDRETYYHCSNCDSEDDFDLCQECLDREGSCTGHHRLIKRKWIMAKGRSLVLLSSLKGIL